MGMAALNFISEAKRLVKLIDETKIEKKEDWIFFKSMEARVKANGYVKESMIFWLRDIKDRQL